MSVVFLLQIEATNTCGENSVLNDGGYPYPPGTIDKFQKYYVKTRSGQEEGVCNANDANLENRHPPQNLVDDDGK